MSLRRQGMGFVLMAAVAVVATLPIIVFTFLVQRHLVRGLARRALQPGRSTGETLRKFLL